MFLCLPVDNYHRCDVCCLVALISTVALYLYDAATGLCFFYSLVTVQHRTEVQYLFH